MQAREIYRFNAITVKILMAFFTGKKKPLKLYGTAKDNEKPKQSWKKRTKLDGSHFLISKYLKNYSN